MENETGLEKQLKIAALYKSQGLYSEAKKAYDAALEILKSNLSIQDRDKLLNAVVQKINEIEETAQKVESAPTTPEMAPQVQTLIKNLFTFSTENDPDIKALEGAITLAKFGQVERAIFEFNNLLKRDKVRLVAAKNIIRCYHLLSQPAKAVETYHEWLSNAFFTSGELHGVRNFLTVLFKQEVEMLKQLNNPPVVKEQAGEAKSETPDSIDIGSIVITLDNGPLKGKPIELDVQLQSGNMVSMFIESKEKSLLDNLNVGFRLRNIQFNSTVAIFRGQGVISAKAMIDSGPKQGEYHLDIKIEDSRDKVVQSEK